MAHACLLSSTPPPQRDLAELLYRCARNGRPELHARFMGDPELAAAFDELLEKDPGVRGPSVGGRLDHRCVGSSWLALHAAAVLCATLSSLLLEL